MNRITTATKSENEKKDQKDNKKRDKFGSRLAGWYRKSAGAKIGGRATSLSPWCTRRSGHGREG